METFASADPNYWAFREARVPFTNSQRMQSCLGLPLHLYLNIVCLYSLIIEIFDYVYLK